MIAPLPGTSFTMSVQEAAEVLETDIYTVRFLCRRGELIALRHPAPWGYRLQPDFVMAYKEGARLPPRAERRS